MADVKVHLLKAGKGRFRRAACGMQDPPHHTTDPGQVSCLTCRGSLYMADVELRIANPQQPKRRKRR